MRWLEDLRALGMTAGDMCEYKICILGSLEGAGCIALGDISLSSLSRSCISRGLWA